MSLPIVFIGGLSGAGKTCVGNKLESHGFLHLNIDPDRGDGIKVNNLREQWTAFQQGDPSPMATELALRAREAGAAGVVLSFPSTAGLWLERIRPAKAVGLGVVLLVGPVELCLKAFLEREEQTGRRLKEDDWKRNNLPLIDGISKPEYDEFKLAVFREDGSRIPREEIAARVRERAGSYCGVIAQSKEETE